MTRKSTTVHETGATPYQLRLYVAVMLRPDDQRVGTAVGAQLSFKALLDLLATLHRIRESDPALIEELRSLLAEAGSVEERRNRLVHSGWGPGKVPGTFARIKVTARMKEGLSWKTAPGAPPDALLPDLFEQLTPLDVAAVADDCKAVGDRLQAFVKRSFDRENGSKP